MPGSREGGLKAREKNLARDPDWYRKIGSIGGKRGRTGGFASNQVGPDGLTGRERALVAGAKGGRVSRRGPGRSPAVLQREEEAHRKRARSLSKNGASRAYIAELLGRSVEWVNAELDGDNSKKAPKEVIDEQV